MRGRLVFTAGSRVGTAFELTGFAVGVGRGHDCTLQLTPTATAPKAATAMSAILRRRLAFSWASLTKAFITAVWLGRPLAADAAACSRARK